MKQFLEKKEKGFFCSAASIVLFAIAGVMLILIIILLLIKPTDETLEDVDKKADKKNKKE